MHFESVRGEGCPPGYRSSILHYKIIFGFTYFISHPEFCILTQKYSDQSDNRSTQTHLVLYHCIISYPFISDPKKLLLLPPANEVWGKVIFSVACVKNSVHKGGLLPGRGCMVPGVGLPGGMHPTGMHSSSGRGRGAWWSSPLLECILVGLEFVWKRFITSNYRLSMVPRPANELDCIKHCWRCQWTK